MLKIARAVTVSLGLVALFGAVGLAGQKEAQEEPLKLIKAANHLESAPLAKDAKETRSWALKWLIQTDKVSVKVCSFITSGLDKKYKYTSEVFSQYTIGMAAFKLSNPTLANDEELVQLSGVRSALRAYATMAGEQPKAKNEFLDDLLARRADGSLGKFVAQNNCKGD